MEDKILKEINKIDEDICKMVKQMQCMPHNSTMKIYCIEITKSLNIREYLVNKYKEQNNGNNKNT